MSQPEPLTIIKGKKSRPTGNLSSAWHNLGRTQTVRSEEAIEAELTGTKGEIDDFLGELFKENPEIYDEYLSAMASYGEVERKGGSEGDDEKTLNGNEGDDENEGEEWTEENEELLKKTLARLEKMEMGTEEDRKEIEEKAAEVQARLDKMLGKMKDQVEKDTADQVARRHPDPWEGHPEKKTEAGISQTSAYHPIMEYTLHGSINKAGILRDVKVRSVEVFLGGEVTREMRDQIKRVGKVVVEYFNCREIDGQVLDKEAVTFTTTVLFRNRGVTTSSPLKFLVNPVRE